MEHKIQPHLTQEVDQVDPNRIVVYGSNNSGANTLTKELQRYLQEVGIDHPSVELVRDAALIHQSFYGQKTPEDQVVLPRGVVVFPEMRQYWEGRGMFIPTYGYEGLTGPFPFDLIKELCTKHGIPFVRFEENTLDGKIQEGLRTLMLPKPR